MLFSDIDDIILKQHDFQKAACQLAGMFGLRNSCDASVVVYSRAYGINMQREST